jgi:hypothetical protein
VPRIKTKREKTITPDKKDKITASEELTKGESILRVKNIPALINTLLKTGAKTLL